MIFDALTAFNAVCGGVADNAEDQVPFRAWLFRGNPMPRKKLGVAKTPTSINLCEDGAKK